MLRLKEKLHDVLILPSQAKNILITEVKKVIKKGIIEIIDVSVFWTF